MPRAVPKEVFDQGLVREAENVVEILARVFRITAGVRPAQGRHGALRSEEVAQRVGEERRFREGADEDDVDAVRQLVLQVLEARVADVRDLVPARFAPDPDDLRHDAREIRVHHAGVQRVGGSLRDEIDDSHPELLHAGKGYQVVTENR